MKITFSLVSILVLISSTGCTNTSAPANLAATSATQTVFDNAIIGGEPKRVVLTESGDGTEQNHIGIDFQIAGPNSSR